MNQIVNVVLIGAGGFARYHLNSILNQASTTRIKAICEPDIRNEELVRKLFQESGQEPPVNIPDLSDLLRKVQGQVEAALIVSPHKYHYNQVKACLEAGLDVLVEKPMVMNVREAKSLISIRDQTKKLLVVAFPGSLSPKIRMAVHLLRSGELGKLLSIAGTVWQSWGPGTVGTWRQDPSISGGGFMFDTGAHLLNSVSDLAGEDFTEVSAWLDNNDRPVDTRAAVIGRLESGALVTLTGCGEAIPSCASDIRVFTTKAILYTGVWGEKLQIQYTGEQSPADIPVPPSTGVWEQFLAVREGKIKNPCPPEVGLRMAKLWDAIKLSSDRGGIPVKCKEL